MLTEEKADYTADRSNLTCKFRGKEGHNITVGLKFGSTPNSPDWFKPQKGDYPHYWSGDGYEASPPDQIFYKVEGNKIWICKFRPPYMHHSIPFGGIYCPSVHEAETSEPFELEKGINEQALLRLVASQKGQDKVDCTLAGLKERKKNLEKDLAIIEEIEGLLPSNFSERVGRDSSARVIS